MRPLARYNAGQGKALVAQHRKADIRSRRLRPWPTVKISMNQMGEGYGEFSC